MRNLNRQKLSSVDRGTSSLISTNTSVTRTCDIEPFLSITLHNLFRLRGLSIYSYHPHLEPLFRKLSVSAPELKYLEIQSPYVVRSDMKLQKTFRGRIPRLQVSHYIGPTQTSAILTSPPSRGSGLRRHQTLPLGIWYPSSKDALRSDSSAFVSSARLEHPLLLVDGFASPPCGNSGSAIQPAPLAFLTSLSSRSARR